MTHRKWSEIRRSKGAGEPTPERTMAEIALAKQLHIAMAGCVPGRTCDPDEADSPHYTMTQKLLDALEETARPSGTTETGDAQPSSGVYGTGETAPTVDEGYNDLDYPDLGSTRMPRGA